MLVVDQFIYLLFMPGEICMPDHRCLLRMHTILLNLLSRDISGESTENSAESRYGSHILSVLPFQVRWMVLRVGAAGCRMGRNELSLAFVRAWWDYNGRPVFFNHYLTAKLVRRAIRQEEGQEQDED